MLVPPGLQQRVIQDMLARAVAAYHGEIIHRLDARADPGKQARRARWRLRQQDGIANALLLDLLLYRLRQPLDEAPLHILVTLEPGEWPFLRRNIRRRLVSRVTDRRVDALDNGN